MGDLVNNNWFISIITTVGGVLVLPIGKFLYNNIKAYFGVFSGTYLAITSDPSSKKYIIEIVKCKHINKSIKGKIFFLMPLLVA